jgi:hypothetical protein
MHIVAYGESINDHYCWVRPQMPSISCEKLPIISRSSFRSRSWVFSKASKSYSQRSSKVVVSSAFACDLVRWATI